MDWGRVVGKKRFLRFMSKVGGEPCVGEGDRLVCLAHVGIHYQADCDDEEVGRVRAVMKEYYSLISDSFDYYGAFHSLLPCRLL